MQLFPRDGHRFARFQVCHSARYFLGPSLFDRFIPGLKAVEQRIGQCCALVRGEGEGSF